MLFKSFLHDILTNAIVSLLLDLLTWGVEQLIPVPACWVFLALPSCGLN